MALAIATSGYAADQVQTTNGAVEGTVGTNAQVRTFRGIPYAAPPIGELRWRPPQPLPKWNGVRKADQFGPRCMQASLFSDMQFRSKGVSEDCLYLNVWTPAKSADEHLPVLVYIYGGGFQAGDSSEGRYDGEALAGKGIVFVSMNYRLGVFGFFSHPALTKESGHNASGNYGLLDQAEALRWVQSNIAQFGGDPKKVTIAGESAGSFSVSALMAAPISKNLFAGAIGESGAIVGPTLPAQPHLITEEEGAKFATTIGATSLAALRAMSAEALLAAAPKAGAMRFAPNIDGYFFPESPIAVYNAGKQSHIPLLAGWNADEGTPQVLLAKDKPTPENFNKQLQRTFGPDSAAALKVYPAGSPEEALQSAKSLSGDQFIAYSTWKWLELQEQTGGGKPVYRYLFTRARQPKPGTMVNGVSAAEFGATHSSEIEYALGNLSFNKEYVWQPQDQKVSELMQNYWVNFVKKGDPNGPGLPQWPTGTAANSYAMMRLDVDAHAAPQQNRERYVFLDTFYSKTRESSSLAPFTQPVISSRKAPLLKADGFTFRDLNRNGVLDKYEDWRLPIGERITDLLGRMTIEEKAGLMIHTSLAGFTGPNGEVLDTAAAGSGRPPGAGRADGPQNRALQGRPNPNNVTPMDRANPHDLVLERNIRWILVRPTAGEAPEITAKFHNSLQEMAEGARLGIPLVFSTDPRHSTARLQPGQAAAKPVLSQWPWQLGLGAMNDAEAVREFGSIAARELRALGIQVTLSPMADVATEPRWGRIDGTFGDDAAFNARMVKAYIEGFQGKQLGPESVMTVVKHFPGDGPTKDGYDPHNSYGKWTVYPGNKFNYHLSPFKAAFDSGTGAVMGGYFIPTGKDTVAIAFSKAMIEELLRSTLGYEGLVITDWLRNMPWGVERMSEKDRQKMIVLAGCDQIGGDNDPKYIIENVKAGALPQHLIDASARRVLKAMFQLGMFENPYVEPERARTVVASKESMDAGHKAQLKSLVLLKNANSMLPAAEGRKIYVQNVAKDAASRFGTVVDDPKQADIAIIRVNAPYALYPYGGSFFGNTHVGTLAYTGAANASELDDIMKLAASGVPTIVCVSMDRPAILTEFIDKVAGVFASFGSDDSALMEVVFGRYRPTGKLPFDLPSDMVSVMSQAEDVAHDLDAPLFRFGFGISYQAPALSASH